MKEKKEYRRIVLIIIILLVLIDQMIKIFLIITNFKFSLNNTMQIVSKDGLQSKDNISYILISIIVVIIFVRYIKSNNMFIKKSNKIVISFAIAGVISNVIDRIWKGYVITYISISENLNFNLSYIYIIIAWIGMAIILTKNTANEIKQKRVEVNEKNNSRK